MDKFDVVDIYDENKNKTGKTKVRYNDPFDGNDYIKCLELLEIK